jgi:hypothetical protein
MLTAPLGRASRSASNEDSSAFAILMSGKMIALSFAPRENESPARRQTRARREYHRVAQFARRVSLPTRLVDRLWQMLEDAETLQNRRALIFELG